MPMRRLRGEGSLRRVDALRGSARTRGVGGDEGLLLVARGGEATGRDMALWRRGGNGGGSPGREGADGEL